MLIMAETRMFRSAWLKWARAVEHQRDLGRAVTTYRAAQPFEYLRTDNMDDADDPLVRVHWRFHLIEPHPERWSVLLGDFLANLRDALDHALWDAVNHHSGPPAKPTLIHFPICVTENAFTKVAQKMEPLVAPEVWDVIRRVQPFHLSEHAHKNPLAALHWLSNRDKHRALHILARIHLDLTQDLVSSSQPIHIVEHQVHEGPIEDRTVLVRIKFERPSGARQIDLQPIFAHGETLQISDDPRPENRTLASTLQELAKAVLEVLFSLDHVMGQQTDLDSLHLGEPSCQPTMNENCTHRI